MPAAAPTQMVRAVAMEIRSASLAKILALKAWNVLAIAKNMKMTPTSSAAAIPPRTPLNPSRRPKYATRRITAMRSTCLILSSNARPEAR